MGLIEAVEAWLPGALGRAEALDRAGAFPAEDVAELRSVGVLTGPLPERFGGSGAGTEPGGTALIRDLLQGLGRGNLAVARLFEAHVNALRLITRFGSAVAQAAAAADVRAGALFGLWVTDAAGEAVSATHGVLRGSKSPCSGAGHCGRALVTAVADGGIRMAVVALAGAEPVVPLPGMSGMRAAANGRVDLTGVPVRDWIGGPGDYLREPDFSAGAWRASAAACGAIEALVAAVRDGLRARGMAEAPMQLARFGALVTARETARLWVARMAAVAEAAAVDDAALAVVKLGRGAVERAGLDAIELAQRSLGMAAFVAPAPVERIARDLAVYLRQPGIDAVLLEAASWHLASDTP